MADNTLSVVLAASAEKPGVLPFRADDLNSTVKTIKDGAGRLYGIHIENSNALKTYVHFYDDAAPVVGTTVPVKTLMIPPNGGYDCCNTVPVEFSTAIKVAATTTVNGSVGPVSNLLFNADYR